MLCAAAWRCATSTAARASPRVLSFGIRIVLQRSDTFLRDADCVLPVEERDLRAIGSPPVTQAEGVSTFRNGTTGRRRAHLFRRLPPVDDAPRGLARLDRPPPRRFHGVRRGPGLPQPHPPHPA